MALRQILLYFGSLIKTFFILRSVFSLFWPKYCNLSWFFAKSFFIFHLTLYKPRQSKSCIKKCDVFDHENSFCVRFTSALLFFALFFCPYFLQIISWGMKFSRILIDFFVRARFSGHFDFYFSLPFYLKNLWCIFFLHYFGM